MAFPSTTGSSSTSAGLTVTAATTMTPSTNTTGQSNPLMAQMVLLRHQLLLNDAKLTKILMFLRTESDHLRTENAQHDHATGESSEIGCVPVSEVSVIDDTMVVTDQQMSGETADKLAVCMPKQFPSDKANFSGPLTPDNKQFLISVSPCQPDGPFPHDTGQKGRCFSASYYTEVNEAGVKIRRATLCYSPGDNCAYCQACWLFSKNRKSSWLQDSMTVDI